MAGNYPDVPSWRIPYDRDGTVGVTISPSSVIDQLSSADLISMNDETNTGALVSKEIGAKIALLFPRLMDIDGLFVVHNAYLGSAVTPAGFQWSPDTTNGLDGTWTSFSVGSGVYGGNTQVGTLYRSDIWSGTVGGVRAVRWNTRATYDNNYVACVHLYGEPTAGEDANRLEVWHPTLDQRVGPAYFDVGNVQRGSSADITFRVKNLSSTLTANDVRLSFDALTDTTPSVSGQYQLSSDGVNFYAQRTISSIAPGAISAVYTMRRITPSNAVLSLWTLRMNVEATTGWS